MTPRTAPTQASVHPIRRWREEQGLTRIALARKAGVSADVIQCTECGRVAYTSCDTAMRIARALGVETDVLIQALIDFNEGERS